MPDLLLVYVCYIFLHLHVFTRYPVPGLALVVLGAKTLLGALGIATRSKDAKVGGHFELNSRTGWRFWRWWLAAGRP